MAEVFIQYDQMECVADSLKEISEELVCQKTQVIQAGHIADSGWQSRAKPVYMEEIQKIQKNIQGLADQTSQLSIQIHQTTQKIKQMDQEAARRMRNR